MADNEQAVLISPGTSDRRERASATQLLLPVLYTIRKSYAINLLTQHWHSGLMMHCVIIFYTPMWAVQIDIFPCWHIIFFAEECKKKQWIMIYMLRYRFIVNDDIVKKKKQARTSLD